MTVQILLATTIVLLIAVGGLLLRLIHLQNKQTQSSQQTSQPANEVLWRRGGMLDGNNFSRRLFIPTALAGLVAMMVFRSAARTNLQNASLSQANPGDVGHNNLSAKKNPPVHNNLSEKKNPPVHNNLSAKKNPPVHNNLSDTAHNDLVAKSEPPVHNNLGVVDHNNLMAMNDKGSTPPPKHNNSSPGNTSLSDVGHNNVV